LIKMAKSTMMSTKSNLIHYFYLRLVDTPIPLLGVHIMYPTRLSKNRFWGEPSPFKVPPGDQILSL
jgi:hypothetical protein